MSAEVGGDQAFREGVEWWKGGSAKQCGAVLSVWERVKWTKREKTLSVTVRR